LSVNAADPYARPSPLVMFSELSLPSSRGPCIAQCRPQWQHVEPECCRGRALRPSVADRLVVVPRRGWTGLARLHGGSGSRGSSAVAALATSDHVGDQRHFPAIAGTSTQRDGPGAWASPILSNTTRINMELIALQIGTSGALLLGHIIAVVHSRVLRSRDRRTVPPLRQTSR
jgi:hypothetical protein